MKEEIAIVKIGGNVIDDEPSLDLFLKQFSLLKMPKILVHGGGKLATEMAAQMNVPQQLVGGRRITDAATLKIITMVYAGWINKNIVAKLQAESCNAIGFSGADGNLVQAHKRTATEIDYGFVGDVDSVNAELLCDCLEEKYSVVVAPLTHDGQGHLLNTNADTIAQSIAVALADKYEVTLVYCFEKSGLLADVENEHSCIRTIGKATVASMEKEGIIHTGMLPKIHNALQAIEAGVKKVYIGKWSELPEIINEKAGTKIQL